MANQTYTLAELTLAVRHALGKTPNTNVTSMTDLVNDGIQMVVAAHPWHWRIKKDVLSSAGSGANALGSLPADFAGIHTLHTYQADDSAAPDTMLDEVLPIGPAIGQNQRSKYVYLIDYTAQASVTSEPVPTINVFPAPPTASANAFLMAYFRTIPALSGATDIPDVPANFHILIKHAVRAHALVEEHNPNADMEWGIYQGMLAKFIEQDNALRSNANSATPEASINAKGAVGR